SVARATDRLGARGRWGIGQPYVGEEVPVLLVRRAGRGGGHQGEPPATMSVGLPATVTALPKARGPFLAFRLAAARAAYPEVLPLDSVAGAIVAAYVALGEIRAQAGASLAL